MLFVRCFYLSDAQHPPVYSHLCHETRPHHKKYFCILKKYIPLLRLSITILLSASSLFAQTPVDSLPQPDSLTAARVVAFREQIKPVPGGYAVRVADLPISKEAKAPIPYASVYLTAKNDTLITNFTLTDTTGLATIKKRPVVFTVATGIRINPGK